MAIVLCNLTIAHVVRFGNRDTGYLDYRPDQGELNTPCHVISMGNRDINQSCATTFGKSTDPHSSKVRGGNE